MTLAPRLQAGCDRRATFFGPVPTPAATSAVSSAGGEAGGTGGGRGAGSPLSFAVVLPARRYCGSGAVVPQHRCRGSAGAIRCRPTNCRPSVGSAAETHARVCASRRAAGRGYVPAGMCALQGVCPAGCVPCRVCGLELAGMDMCSCPQRMSV